MTTPGHEAPAPRSPAGLTTAAEPDGAPRLAGLDVMRGIAILGILFMNISDMGASFFATGRAAPSLGWTGADRIAWTLREILADGTARCLLELLFGVGMVILTDRAAQEVDRHPVPSDWAGQARHTLFGPRPVMRAYYRRNIVLFLFGVVHLAILMWPGDILHTYAIAAMVAFLFRRLRPGALLMLGLLLAASELTGSGLGIHQAQVDRTRAAVLREASAAGRPLAAADRAVLAQADRDEAACAARRAAQHTQLLREDRDRAAATGSAATWFAAIERDNRDFYLGSDSGEVGSIWEAASTMLIGAALFRWGVIQGRRSRRFYWGLLVAGYAVGLTLRVSRTLTELRFVDAPSLWFATFEVARLATTLGHLALIWLLLGTVTGARMLRPFAAAGRTALTLYIGQTVICQWLLFPPFALALYGRLGWADLMLTAAVVDLGLLMLAVWWTRRFAIAPVEWAWRSIVAGRLLAFRRGAPGWTKG